jgi:hypothetical protein
MMRRLRFALATLALLQSVTVGCGTEEARTPTAVVRDSAGIRIVENAEHGWPEGRDWRLAAEPRLDIGVFAGDPDYELFQVAGALRLSDGRIVVANGGSRELRIYGASGEFVSAVGREGGGPGEFEDLVALRLLAGDSLLAYDWGLQRVSVFDSRGDFVRANLLQLLSEGGYPDYVTPFDDGSLLVAVEQISQPGGVESGVHRNNLLYLRCDNQGVLVDTLGQFSGSESFTNIESDGVLGGPLAFGRRPQGAVHGAGFYFGPSDYYEIGYYTIEGELRRLIRLQVSNSAVTPDDIERYKERESATAPDETYRTLVERLLSVQPYPETMPAYGELVVDVEGNLWVAEYRNWGDDARRWHVFDPDGALLGVVEMPAGFTAYQIGTDFVLGSWRDESDVEHIRLYELIKD